jgi:ParB/RepB/Spo0J family partition protein
VTTEVFEIDILQLTAHPQNPRGDLGDLTELAASIESVGILQPILVAPQNGHFMVVAGHRRLAAALKCELATVPVIVREDYADDDQAQAVAMMVENLLREDLTIADEARGFQTLVDAGLTQREIADRVGCSQSHVSRALAVGKLPEKAKEWLASGELSRDDAITLGALPDDVREDMLDADVSPTHREIEYAEWEQKAEERRLTAIEEAKAGDDPYVDYSEVSGVVSKLTKRLLSSLKYDYEVPSPAKHAKLDCHAVTVDGNGILQAVCTKPKSHPKKKATPASSHGAAPAVEKSAAQQENERLCEELDAANTARWDWLGSHVHRIKKTDALRFVVRHIFGPTSYGELCVDTERLSEACGVDFSQGRGNEADAELIAWASNDAKATCLLVLLAASQREGDFEPQPSGFKPWSSVSLEQLRNYLGDLTEMLGYKPSEVEKRFCGMVDAPDEVAS